MEQLHNFKFIDLHAKLSMGDNDFDAWLEELGCFMTKEPVRNVAAEHPFTWPRIIGMDCGAAQRKTVVQK